MLTDAQIVLVATVFLGGWATGVVSTLIVAWPRLFPTRSKAPNHSPLMPVNPPAPWPCVRFGDQLPGAGSIYRPGRSMGSGGVRNDAGGV